MNGPDPSSRHPSFDATITLPGRVVQVRYRLGVGHDPVFRAERARAEEALRNGVRSEAERRYRRLAAHAIEAWDLVDRDGQPVPISEAAFESLPIGALQRIVREATA